MNETNKLKDKFSVNPLLKSLLLKAKSGELDKITQQEIDKSISNLLFFEYMGDKSSSKQKMLESLSKFLNRLNNYFKMSDKQLAEKFDQLSKFKKKEESLPLGCNMDDSEEVIAFARKLDKEEYNYSDAGRLLNRQRQTVKDWVDKNKHGLVASAKKDGERAMIKRDILLKTFRDLQ